MVATKESATLAERQVSELERKVVEEGIPLSDLVQFLSDMGLSEPGKKTSRKDTKAAYANALARLDGEDRELVEKIVGSIDVLRPGTELDLTKQENIDAVVGSLREVRRVIDILTGSHDGVKTSAMDEIEARSEAGWFDDEEALYSVQHGMKLVRRTSRRRGDIDQNVLRDVVGDKVWKEISVARRDRVLDLDALAFAMKKGKVTVAQLQEAVSPSKIIVSFVPSDIPKDQQISSRVLRDREG